MEQSYAKEQGFRWSWLSLTGHGEDKTNSYGAVTFGKTPSGEAYKFFCETRTKSYGKFWKSCSNS